MTAPTPKGVTGVVGGGGNTGGGGGGGVEDDEVWDREFSKPLDYIQSQLENAGDLLFFVFLFFCFFFFFFFFFW